MSQNDNSTKYEQLRAAFSNFVYEGFAMQELSGGLRLEFVFKVNEELVFRPSMFFADSGHFKALSADLKQVMAFNIGMVEMISYWKAFCSPRILIKPYRLSSKQELWWKKLFRYGLAEFFFTNGIEMPGEELLQFDYPAEAKPFSKFELNQAENGIIIPVGGGKDSVVTLELLKSAGPANMPLVMNHREATRKVLKVGGFESDSVFEIRRTIDPLLLQLNQQGFLNGHTPFSALLAFVTTFAAALSGKKHIALSNESSANEASIPGTKINHQYSKSFEFEQDFRNYLADHLLEGVNYFSFLRPLNELQIGKLFSGFSQYHGVFKSCNVGSKTDTWCCHCSKCLFTFIMLAPYLSEKELNTIFGEDLFRKSGLASTLDQLTGVAENKPFECVGTINEVNAALQESIRQRTGEKLPELLEYYKKQGHPANVKNNFVKLLNDFHEPHALEESFSNLLTSAINSK